MKTMPMTRRMQNGEYAIVAGLFLAAFGCWNLKEAFLSEQANDWLGGLWLLVGLSLLISFWKASAGVHELHWEANRAKIISDGKVVFEGSLQEFKAIVGDQLGCNFHIGAPFVYRVKRANLDGDLRASLDAVCAA